MREHNVVACVQEIEVARMAHGGFVSPRYVVEYAAQHPDGALHGYMEWDNTVAGPAYRLQQAAYLLRVAVTVLPGETTSIRAYVSLHADRGTVGYRALVDVLGDVERRNQLVAEALREADSWMRRYQRLAELEPIRKAIRKVQGKQKKESTHGQ